VRHFIPCSGMYPMRVEKLLVCKKWDSGVLQGYFYPPVIDSVKLRAVKVIDMLSDKLYMPYPFVPL
jgi:hypothetical protein